MKKKLIIVFFIFIAIGVGLFYLLTMGNIGVKYDTAPVVKDEISKYVQDVGRISSRNIRRYYGNGNSKVEEMTLKLGDHVEKGQLLVKYEDNTAAIDIEIEKVDLQIQNVDIEIQKVDKQIVALKAAYNDAKSSVDMDSVNSASVEIDRIKNQIDTATKDKEKTETLYNEGIVPLAELEQAEEKIVMLQSNLEIAQNTYNQLAKGLSSNMRQKYEAEIGAVLLSKEALEKNKEILEKNKEILEKNKEDLAVYADVEGIVTELNTFEGDKPSVGLMIIEIQDPTEKVVLVDFMVEDAIRIIPGMEAEVADLNLDIKIDSLKVDRVYPIAFVTLSELGVEENRQTVEIGFSESDEALAFGLEVETRVIVDPSREMLLVPKGAVVQKNSKQYVQVLEDGNPVEKEITTGISVDSKIEVVDGVEEGEQVILNYQED